MPFNRKRGGENMKYIVWRLIGFYGFVFLFGHILLYGNNRFAEKRIQEIEAQNYSYETYVTVTDKSTTLHNIIVNTVPISQRSYLLTVSMDDTSGETKELNVSSSVYDSINIGDSILVTVYAGNDDDSVTSVYIGEQRK